MKQPINVLGIICYQGHASAAALVRDGVATDAMIEDRATRRKYETAFPADSIRRILKRNQLDIADVTEVAFAWSPLRTVLGQLGQMTRLGPSPWDYFFARRAGHGELSRAGKFRRMCGVRSDFTRHFGHCPRLGFVSHHLAHSFSACIAADGDEPILSVVADGTGEDAAISFYEVIGGRHRPVIDTPFPHSFGTLYSAVTQLLGFVPDSDEYKVMGLSPYGGASPDPRISAALDSLVRADGGRLTLDLRYFRPHRTADRIYDDSLAELLGGAGKLTSLEARAAVARCVQDLLERRMGELIEQVASRLPRRPRTLCGSGGVFLNCRLNQSLRERFLRPEASLRFDAFHFSPVADDNGSALGAAAYAYQRRSGRRPAPYADLFMGPEYGEEEMLAALEGHEDCAWTRTPDIASEVARRLAMNRVVAFFQGRAEFGPRALGSRSILADPRGADIKDRLNQKIKLREAFRPFAPSVLEERASEFFILPSQKRFPYMNETVSVRPDRAAAIPGVVHVDGTARIQTVSRADRPIFHALLSEFDRLTGVPVLLNTSFNLDTQPIVDSPEDALRCFLSSGIDDLALGPFLVERKR